MYVRFGTSAGYSRTGAVPCTPTQSMNFYIAGMIPSTIYTMYYVTQDSAGLHPGPSSVFTTGAVDPTLALPTYQITAAANRKRLYPECPLIRFCKSGVQHPITISRLQWIFKGESSGITPT